MKHLVKKYITHHFTILLALLLSSFNLFAEQRPFITTWKTDNPGNSCNSCVTISTITNGYNYEVDWDNDGIYETQNLTGSIVHNFGTPGTYTIRIRGDFPRIVLKSDDPKKIVSIDQWGDIQWKSMNNAFSYTNDLIINATDSPDLSLVTDISSMFKFSNFANEDLSNWDVSNVIDMRNMFASTKFNGDISNWDVSSVQHFDGMFENAEVFDQSLENWTFRYYTSIDNMLSNTNLSVENYDNTLIGWASQNITNLNLGAVGLKYCNSEAARTHLINNLNWNISGDKKDCTGIATTIPDSPINLSASILSTSSVKLTWVDKSDNEDFFQLFKKIGSATWLLIAEIPANTTSYTDTGLDIGVEYCYKIRAFNKIGGSDEYSNTCITIEVPDAPTDLTTNIISHNSINIQWTDNADNESKFKLFRKIGNASWSIIAILEKNVTSFTDTGLSYDTEYCYKVRAVNAAGVSTSFSNVDCQTTPEQKPFITRWKTDHIGESCNSCITITTNGSGYNYEVDWNNDGIYESQNLTGSIVHDFGTPGIYTIRIRGAFPSFKAGNDSEKLLSVDQWGDIQWQSMIDAFAHTSFLSLNATDTPNLSQVTSLRGMFDSSLFNDDISQWDVSNVTDMSYMFDSALNFNQDLENWDVSNVTNMRQMFYFAEFFNQDLNNWDITSVTNFENIFSLSNISTTNYDNTLISWAAQNIININLNMGAHGLNYCNGEAARSYLQDTYGWTFSGDQKDCTGVEAPSVPDAPINLSANVLTTSSIELTWIDKSDNEDFFRLFKKIGSDSWQPLTDLPANTSSYTDTGLDIGTEYCYKIRAFNTIGGSEEYSNTCITIETVVPDSPTELTTAVLSSSSIKIQWTDNADNEAQFKLFRKTGTNSWTTVTTLKKNTTSYTDTGLSSGVNYCYKIRAFNTAGASVSFSNVACQPIHTQVPESPSNMLAIPETSSSIKLTWDDNSDKESTYRIFRKTATTSWTFIADKPANSTIHFDEGVVPEVEYCYRVRAINNIGGSPSFTNTDCTSIAINPPDSPSDMVANVNSPNSIELTWTDNSDNETYFKLFRKTATTSWRHIASPSLDATSYSDTELDVGTEYCYRIRAFNTVGGSANFSNTNCATMAVAVSRLMAKDLPLSLYPNPASDQVTLELPQNSSFPVQVELFSIVGQRVLSKQLNDTNNSIDVSGLESGMYILRVGKGKDTQQLKLMVE